MKKILLISAMALATWVSALAGGHLSASTQLFIAERDGEISLDEPTGMSAPSRAPLLRTEINRRLIVAAEEVNGVEMVQAFIHMTNPSQTAGVERLGVIIQEKFDHFVTAMIPVDKIEAVADVAGVLEVNVAQNMELNTDQSRAFTNVDDVINYSLDAKQGGLPYAFTGKGIIVGVIDQGIDFQHTLYNDTAGVTRIKRVWKASSSGLTAYTDWSSLTTDYSSSSHGTHTSTTAAGRSMEVNGITYGGMAPEADIVLVGLAGYATNANLTNAIKNICDYADSQNQPCVISISLGTMVGPHDGTGEMAQAFAQYGGANKNHIICCSAGNSANYASGEFGRSHVEGVSSMDAPMTATVLGYGRSRSATYATKYYAGYTWFYARTDSMALGCQLHIVDINADTIVWSSKELKSGSTSVSGITSYLSGTPTVTFAQDTYSGKNYVQVRYGSSYITNTYASRGYRLAVSVYPLEGSTTIDAWDYNYNTFEEFSAKIGKYVFTAGDDYSCTGNFVSSDDVISVGAYCSKNVVSDYLGESHTLTEKYTVGDICYFSSYQKAGYGPTGVAKPDIAAPGATIVAGINHYDKSGYMANANTSSGYYLVYKNDASSLGSMDGTSMSTPCAAGIIALYLQAAKVAGKTFNTEDIRDVFAHSAIMDQNTVKANFGRYGKIDALNGIRYILGYTTDDPMLLAFPDTLDMTARINQTDTATFTLLGAHLTDNATLTLSDESGYFSVNPTTVSAADARNSVTVSVFYAPKTSGTHKATLTISSPGADPIKVEITGFAPIEGVTPVMLPADSKYITSTSFRADWTDETEPEKVASYTLLVTMAPEYALLDQVDFSQTEKQSSNQASNASQYLPTGWTPGTGLYLDGGCASIKGTMTSATYPSGYEKVTVVVTMKNYYSSTNSTLTVATSQDSYLITGTTDFQTYTVVLNSATTDQISFTGNNYPEIQDIKIYGGDITDPESDANIAKTDSTYRLIEGITNMYQVVEGLRTGGTFNFKVRAVYVDGTTSEWSNIETVTLTGGHMRGDVNHDGIINISDVTKLIDYVLDPTGEDGACPICGDTNQDGIINISDVTKLIDYVLSGTWE